MKNTFYEKLVYKKLYCFSSIFRSFFIHLEKLLRIKRKVKVLKYKVPIRLLNDIYNVYCRKLLDYPTYYHNSIMPLHREKTRIIVRPISCSALYSETKKKEKTLNTISTLTDPSLFNHQNPKAQCHRFFPSRNQMYVVLEYRKPKKKSCECNQVKVCDFTQY